MSLKFHKPQSDCRAFFKTFTFLKTTIIFVNLLHVFRVAGAIYNGEGELENRLLH